MTGILKQEFHKKMQTGDFLDKLRSTFIEPSGQGEAAGTGASTTPTRGAVAASRDAAAAAAAAAPRRVVRDTAERCGRCTMEAVWSACDVFWEFDGKHTGRITRQEYILASNNPPNVMRVRLLRRSRLAARFRDSATPVTLDEFLRLIWPLLQEKDFKLVRRWAQLREAHSTIVRSNFRGQDAELSKVFEHLDPQGEGRICANDVARAQILPREEVQRLTKSRDLKRFWLDKEAFKSMLWPELRSKYIRPETVARIKKEEEHLMNSAFAGAFNLGAQPS